MRSSQLLAAVMAVSTVSASWDNMFDKSFQGLAHVENIIYGRADSSGTDKPTETATDASQPASTGTATGDSSQTTGDSKETATGTGTQDASDTKKTTGTGKETGTATGKSTGTKKTASATHKSYDARLPAGGVSMITPAATAQSQFYKIGDWVTFAWNYTSVSSMPSAIDVLATCSANQATYTLAVNQSTEETGIVLWDTGKYQASASIPLLTETYTLLIYDADSSISATAAAGYLAVQSTFTFGMYTKQAYVNWTDFSCANCVKNGALTAYESATLKMMMGVTGTTVASLLYFAYSFGVL